MSKEIYENPDLKKERQNCPFNKEEITHLLDGGKEKTIERKQLENYILSDEQLKDAVPMEYLSHADKYAEELRKACLLMHKLADSPAGQVPTLRALMGAGLGSAVLKEGNPLALHYVMFIPALMGQGTIDQQAKWLEKAYNLNMIGTYAQTELGHGTFLRGLETRATYDPKTQEFILESPSLTAYKWWPGSLGKTANYAVVMAQLYTKGKCEGTHPFMVQLRDEETHEPLPGILIGEIGPKLGMNTNDNGYLGFEKFRIPRDHLLMKHSQVLEDGTYVKPTNSKLSYATMVFVRVVVCQDMTTNLRKAVTIATRYSCVRRQSELKPGDREPQVMDYQAQQNKLLPPLAATFAFQLAADHLWNLYNTANNNIEQGDLELLPDLHGLSCALKALCSSEAANFVEVCRQSCGGHGYMSCSNFPRIYGQVTAAETYEGENTVLWLQVARYLVKTRKEKSGGLSVKYLIGEEKGPKTVDTTLEGIVKLYRRAAVGLVDVAIAELDKSGRKGEAPHDAWNHAAVYLIKAAQAHARLFVVESFVDSLKEGKLSTPVRTVLSQLCELFIIYWLLERSGDFFLCSNLTKQDLLLLNSKYVELLAAIRPQAVNLVDSFDLRDEVLNSPLGCWDGNVYQRLFDEAAKSPLNQSNVHESFHKYLKPLLKSNL
ncbi:probable peroxisomal acyl-coenzyme A oxidase 1 [Daphnia pulicaria]|uniref:probable peroxisomal acyl-coenzyme A oxidase 1 n=1 Tax=Daphnia pulicaria TaxID=35523 RepID=UPI001EEAAAEA|nr:probable peroxisomal acyl-coenzyme A oxidase 1 [Daphnia pulicaria]XP_046652366.1 probable peroxisomal acyl-coenzyme A oxidase 1 [Daphnia pulicaria]